VTGAMIPPPRFEIDRQRQLIVHIGTEAHSLGIYPPKDSKQASAMLMRIFFLGARAKRQEMASVLAGTEDQELLEI